VNIIVIKKTDKAVIIRGNFNSKLPGEINITTKEEKAIIVLQGK